MAAVTIRLSASTRTQYRVLPGDSLWRIASAIAGRDSGTARVALLTRRLWSLNRARIRSGDADLLTTADVLLLPSREELS